MLINISAFLVVAIGLVAAGVTQLFLNDTGGYTLSAEFKDAGGLLGRNDVTMNGVQVGTVKSVGLTSDATTVRMNIDPGVHVPEGSHAQIMRRSPIGDFIVNLEPGKGPALHAGDAIPLADTRPPVNPQKTIAVLAKVLHAVPGGDLRTVVDQLAVALNGRASDLRTINEGSADLAQRILQVNTQLRALITTGPKVTGVLATHSQELAQDITYTKTLAQILNSNKHQLANLYKNGTTFLKVADGILHRGKANLSCAIGDFGTINSVVGEPTNLRNLISTLTYNHYFFEGADHLVQRGLDGRDWFRVQLLPHQEPAGRSYAPHRGPADVYGANACRSPFGKGVGPGHQPLKLELAPGSQLHRGH